MRTRADIDPKDRDTSSWPGVCLDSLNGRRRKRAEQSINAITAYFRDEPVGSICKKFAFVRSELIRLRDRCLERRPDGQIWGMRAAIPHVRTKAEYVRRAPIPEGRGRYGGCAGALTALFRKYPKIQEIVDRYALRKAAFCSESRLPLFSIHKRFTTACRAFSIPHYEYPFCVKHEGKNALSEYLKNDLLVRHMVAGTDAFHGSEAARQLRTGVPHRKKPARWFLERILGDGHLIDAFFTIEVPHPNGGTVPVVVERIWIVSFEDEATRCGLGYAVSLDVECTADDVLAAVGAYLRPWQPRELTIEGLAYHPKGGFPSKVCPQASWGIPTEILLDNGMANLAGSVREQLEKDLGCAVNFGPVATPERRAIKERFYGMLEQRGFQRLPSTTGSHPKDPRKRDPENAALRFHLKLDHLFDILDVLFADRNGRPTKALGWRSPLEQVRFLLEQEKQEVRQVPEALRNRLGVVSLRVTRNVCGSRESGRRPHINYESERYSSEVLANSPHLLRKKLTLEINKGDLRSLKAYLPDGSEFGVLQALGRWTNVPHSLWVRRLINRGRDRQLEHDHDSSDPIQAVVDELSKQALTSKRAAKRLAKLRRDTGGHPSHPASVDSTASNAYHLNSQLARKNRFLVRRPSKPPMAVVF